MSKQLLAGMLMLAWMGCQGSPGKSPQEVPARDEVMTEHRSLQATHPTGRLGDDCTQFGASGCLSGLCLHTRPDHDLRHPLI